MQNKTKLKLIGLIVVLLIIFLVPFFVHNKTRPIIVLNFSHQVAVGNTKIDVVYADTDSEREQGLSDTKPLESKQGMLFFFDTPVLPGFWMKDMNYPLDIIWVNKDKKIVGVSENLDPKTYPQTFSPSEPIQYVLEVQSGFYKTNSLKKGDNLIF